MQKRAQGYTKKMHTRQFWYSPYNFYTPLELDHGGVGSKIQTIREV